MSIQCLVPNCGHTDPHWLGDHLAEAHGISPDAYQAMFPQGAVRSEQLQKKLLETQKKTQRIGPPSPRDLSVKFAGLEFKVNVGVPEEACLPMPPNYILPRHGALGKDNANALVALYYGRSLYVWGMPGTGKDALFHAWSAQTRTPAIIKNIIPGTDIESWFFSRGFSEGGTFWEEGVVLKALRDGYLCPDGTRVPYLFLVSDFDRADRSQAENLRLITDSIQGRVGGPAGSVYKLFPGTRIVVTANTPGGGDARGRMVSANPIDASIMDRWERCFMFHGMDWRDEEPIVRAKFPLLVAKVPWVFPMMGKATAALRAAIDGDELYAEFSHRGLCTILGHAQDLLALSGPGPKTAQLLKKASRAWLDKLADEETREKAKTCMDPHFIGGILNEGSRTHVASDPLADFS